MALKTTNASILAKAYDIGSVVERTLLEAEVWLKRGDLAQARKKLNTVKGGLTVFMADNKDDLLTSDRIAIQILRDQAAELIENLHSKKTNELLEDFKSLSRLAKKLFSK
jgi:hypothetical protein